MDKLTNDIKFGLDPNPNIFFSPYNLADVSRQLGDLGYKNTDLMPLWFDKLESMLKQHSEQSYIEGARVPFEQAMFGSQKGFVARHYIYQGFANSDEFSDHIDTLLMYNQDKQAHVKGNGSGDYRKVKLAAQRLIDAAKEVKDMQKDMEGAVRNVRDQYKRLKEAHDKHAFLQDNKYINLDLLELQELLIKAGYLQPEEG